MNQSMGTWQRTIDFVVVVFIIYLLFNNGNILTDGTDERMYLPRKYNDL